MKKIALLLLILALYSCSSVPITKRKQLSLVDESQMISTSEKQYNDFLKTHKTINNRDAEMVKRVGTKISKAVEEYFKEHHKEKVLEGYKWEFNLVESKEVNAWCMPGGKVAFYTGILPITEEEVGVAVVMGHEIAHAVARHGSERVSQQMVVQAGGSLLNAGLQYSDTGIPRNLALQAYGVGTNLGVLSYSRKHELEADKLGLIFMAMAGYDPREAVKFWERMDKLSKSGGNEFLSTHPSHEHRIHDIRQYLPEAMKYYKK